MESDSSPLELMLALFLLHWPKIGVVLGTVLIILSRFRWRRFCETIGVVVLGLAMGALVSQI